MRVRDEMPEIAQSKGSAADQLDGQDEGENTMAAHGLSLRQGQGAATEAPHQPSLPLP